ncbi:MAG: hypothetical protein JWO51_1731 [Rhodospirillales bacterium]|nr:hypothetical protein [Rhodospirillales bacterium]
MIKQPFFALVFVALLGGCTKHEPTLPSPGGGSYVASDGLVHEANPVEPYFIGDDGSIHEIGAGQSISNKYALCHSPFVYQLQPGSECYQAALRDRQKQQEIAAASQPHYPASAIAKGAGVVPGAIVCPDYPAVQAAFQLYSARWIETQQAATTRGQSVVVLRQAHPLPDIQQLGCVLLPAGSPLGVKTLSTLPYVTGKLPNNAIVSGFTLPAMIGN